MPMPWNPDKYHQFQTLRSAPFDDLIALVDVYPGLKVVDLGCGTGELTRQLADSLPDSDVLGLDLSPQMLERTQEYVRPGLKFTRADLAKLEGKWDLIISNAALQWSIDHDELLLHLFNCLNPGGQLAVQLPSNHNSITHRTIIEVARMEPYASVLHGWYREASVLPIEVYADLLFQLKAEDILVFEKVYPHVLENVDAIVDWISGTALVPYFERLGNQKDDFTEAIRQKLLAVMQVQPVFYPFRRTFFSARKAR